MSDKEIYLKSESFIMIGCAMRVHRELGNGFLEAVYQEALAIEFSENNVPYEREKSIRINYKGKSLQKRYSADFVCYDTVILELKAVDRLCEDHYSQVINYLKATGFKLGILINFGSRSIEFKRIVL